MEQEIPFGRFGTMLDCSRNAVMKPESLKKWMDILQKLGYNTLLLYTEDTYEVDDNPYFGYFRGRYTQQELKDLDSYAKEHGIELIPCIQTLAHLNCITRWPAYAPHIDTGDILLAGDDAVYDLIEKMFASVANTFHSRTINIGMDEAHMIGRGRYYDLHGDSDRSQILIDHIKKVTEIGKKYGFTLTMWSDMFFRLVVGDYYDSNAKIDETIRRQIPDNVELIYWDYYSTDKKRYDKMLTSHEKIKEGTWFAGGLWSWMGFAPHNKYSMKATGAALKSCREHGVKDVFLTMWGDNGGECSKFALLPSLYYAAQIAKGNTSMSDIRKGFQEMFGISFDRFMLLDLPGTPNDSATDIRNPEKYMLYSDPLMGLMDSTVAGGEKQAYAACARKLGLLKKDPTFGYLFAAQQALCEVLAVKYDLGLRTREAYTSGDREQVAALLPTYKLLARKLSVFYKAYRTQWYLENKGQGFDVQDIRLGGLMTRVNNCADRLAAYANGEIDRIEELEETPLDLCGGGTEFAKQPICFQNWAFNVTTNVI